jgi:hypothetical protein
MIAALEFGRHHADPTIRQYALNCEAIFAWRGLDRDRLAAEPADLRTYLGHAPKFDQRNSKLLREMIWSPNTYRQYQRGGRLLIEHVTGSLAGRRARKAVDNDTWADLRRAAESLMRAKLLGAKRLASLIRLEDLARAAGLQPTDLTNERIVALKGRTHSDKEWDGVKRGAAALDDLRLFPTLAVYLPPQPIGLIERKWRRVFTVPPHLEDELSAWLKKATTIYPDEATSETVREALATPQSKGSRGIFQAAHRNYLATLGEEKGISCVNSLAGCFGEAEALAVLPRWVANMGTPGALKARSMAAYMDCIRLTLECAFRGIWSAVPTTSGRRFRSIRSRWPTPLSVGS